MWQWEKTLSFQAQVCWKVSPISPFPWAWRICTIDANSEQHVGPPHSPVGKESTCNAGDPGLISGLGRSTWEGICYPLQYSWASLVAQLVENPPAMWEACVWFLGWEDPLEKVHIPVFQSGELQGLYSPWGHKELDMTEPLSFWTTCSKYRTKWKR